MVEGRAEPGPPCLQVTRESLDFRAGGDEHRDAALFPDDVPEVAVIQKLLHILRGDLNLRLEPGIEGAGLQHLRAVQVPGVEGGVHRRREPDETAPGSLAQRQAELQLGRGLVNLVDYQGVVAGDEVVLKPPPGNAGGDDDDVPRGGLGRGLPLPIHHPVAKGLLQDRLGDGTDRQGFPGAGPGDDAERLALPGPLDELLTMPLVQQGFDFGAQGQLDGLARGAGGRDDDDPAPRMGSAFIGGRIEGEMVIAGRVHSRKLVASGQW